MKQSIEEEDLKGFQESHAVHRLLEVAQKRNFLEESWHQNEKKELKISSRTKLRYSNRNLQGKGYRDKELSQSFQKSMEEQKLRELARETINNEEEESFFERKKQSKKGGNHLAITMKLLMNAKLRPINSNLTFYRVKTGDKKRYISTSLAFYKGSIKEKTKSKSYLPNQNSFRVIKQTGPQPRYARKKEEEPHNPIIYFKPNKSQTVRELLNQLRQQKAKSHDIILNSIQKKDPIEYIQPQVNFFSQQQLRIMNRYKRFIPFQKDDSLLFRKVFEGENVWVKKFKESWQRRRQDQEGKISCFKKLIVNV